MSAPGRYVVTLTNDAIGSGNYAQVSFDCRGIAGMTEHLTATQFTYFLAYGTVMAVNSRISGVSYLADGSLGSVPCNFDASYWSDLRTQFPAYGAPAQTNFNFAFGAGALTPLGTSALFLEDTATPGRRSTGRKYLPFVSASFVTASGELSATAQSNMETNYTTLLLTASGPVNETGVEVRSKFPLGGGSTYAITGCRVQPTLANLRRRRR